MDSLEQVREKIETLSQHMQQSLPDYPQILNTIHENLKKQPELLYHLSDEEISKVVGGLEKFHNVEVTQPNAKRAITAKAAKSLTLDDI